MELHEIDGGKQVIVTVGHEREHNLLLDVARPIAFEATNRVANRFLPESCRTVYGVVLDSLVEARQPLAEAIYPHQIVFRSGQVMKLGRRLFDRALGDETPAQNFVPNYDGSPLVAFYMKKRF